MLHLWYSFIIRPFVLNKRQERNINISKEDQKTHTCTHAYRHWLKHAIPIYVETCVARCRKSEKSALIPADSDEINSQRARAALHMEVVVFYRVFSELGTAQRGTVLTLLQAQISPFLFLPPVFLASSACVCFRCPLWHWLSASFLYFFIPSYERHEEGPNQQLKSALVTSLNHKYSS